MSELRNSDIIQRIKKSKNEDEYNILVSEYIDELLSMSDYIGSQKKCNNYSNFISDAHISEFTFMKLRLYSGSHIKVTTETLFKIVVTLELADDDINTLFAIYGYDYSIPTYINRCYYEVISLIRAKKLHGKRNSETRHCLAQAFLNAKKIKYRLV